MTAGTLGGSCHKSDRKARREGDRKEQKIMGGGWRKKRHKKMKRE